MTTSRFISKDGLPLQGWILKSLGSAAMRFRVLPVLLKLWAGSVKIMKRFPFRKGKGKVHVLQARTASREPLETIVFDFDGTLAEFHLDFGLMKQQLALLASEYLGDVLTLGLPVLEWLDHLEGEIRALDPVQAIEFHARAHQVILDMELEASREGALFPFTRELLKRLEKLGVHTAIITRNCAAAVKMVFPDMQQYCSCFLARDHVFRVKPDPEHLQRALNHFGTAPEHSLMVGDHPLDVQTGKRAGTLTAGVASGSASWSELTQSGADWVSSDCEALFRTLELGGFLQSS